MVDASLSCVWSLPCVLLAMSGTSQSSESPGFRMIDVAARVGLDEQSAARVAVADLDGDGRPDLILDRTSVWLNRALPLPPDDPSRGADERNADGADAGFRFEPVESLLESPGKDGVSIFVDLDGDRTPDAVIARSGEGTLWQRGRGDGRFDPAQPIGEARPGTVASIAAGDADRDGWTDLFIGRWYRAYGESLDAFPADLLLARVDEEGDARFARVDERPLVQFERAALPEDEVAFDEEHDAGGRPLYGTMIVTLLDQSRATPPQLVSLAYGRRWNRLYARSEASSPPAQRAPNPTHEPTARPSPFVWRDVAPALGFDGDDQRSGEYPAWLAERAKTDPRFARTTEKPFRANGNTFDMAIGDIDGDGHFDAVIAEITHAWAGPSSDRSRVLLQRDGRFESPPAYSLDRIPSDDSPDAQRWNQGDLFVELADLDLDGRLDVLLASGDYPDAPPFDERLRLFMQRAAPDESGRRLVDASAALGVDLPGCGQIALADFDLDGRIDIVAGQSFTRFTPAMIEAAGGRPRVRLLLNRRNGAAAGEADDARPSRDRNGASDSHAAHDPHAISLELIGDPARGIAAVPFGAIVEARTLDADGVERTQVLQLVGPGGHAGKQSESRVPIGLGAAREAAVRITWPCEPPIISEWKTLRAGRHRLSP